MSIQPPTIDTLPPVISRTEQRLMALRQEYEAGQAQMGALEQPTRELHETMLRISGAIAVLEDLLADEKAGLGASRQGAVTMSGTGLRKSGDTVSQVVYFNPQQATAFARPPNVQVTVLGTLPYATSVSAIDTTKFKLTLTSIVTPAEDNIAPITVQWIALSVGYPQTLP